MEKMIGMKGILTPNEKEILGILERNLENAESEEGKRDFVIYTTAFATAMKCVKYQMEVLPGEEFIERLEKLLKEFN